MDHDSKYVASKRPVVMIARQIFPSLLRSHYRFDILVPFRLWASWGQMRLSAFRFIWGVGDRFRSPSRDSLFSFTVLTRLGLMAFRGQT